jgi:hypothetical protein
MKFTTVGSEGARNLLREKQRRGRLAAKELRVQFPQFPTLRLSFAFSDASAQPPAAHSIVLHPPARAYFVYPCPYSDCTGEIDLADAVAHVAEHGHSHTTGHTRCTGTRVRGRAGKTACDLGIEYSISVDA